MTALSREEFDLQYRWMDEKWEAKWEASLKILDARLEARLEQQAAQFAQWKACEQRLASMRQTNMRRMNDEFKLDMAAGLAEYRKDCRSVKIVTVSTAIASVMAIAAFNATVLSNMVTSYESGKSTALAFSASVERLAQLEIDMKRTRERVDAVFESLPASKNSPLERTEQ